ncbi:exported hypothetical protein [Candidatus Terasakiella magnetica]|nr:exported hypothetical protein [Candidatus Terasakiella magnetica]
MRAIIAIFLAANMAAGMAQAAEQPSSSPAEVTEPPAIAPGLRRPAVTQLPLPPHPSILASTPQAATTKPSAATQLAALPPEPVAEDSAAPQSPAASPPNEQQAAAPGQSQVAPSAPAEAQAAPPSAPNQSQATPAVPRLPDSVPAGPKGTPVFVVTGEHLAAISIGVIGGLVVLDSVIGVPTAAAAFVGGLAGQWWHSTHSAPTSDIYSVTHRTTSRVWSISAARDGAIRDRWLPPSTRVEAINQ